MRTVRGEIVDYNVLPWHRRLLDKMRQEIRTLSQGNPRRRKAESAERARAERTRRNYGYSIFDLGG